MRKVPEIHIHIHECEKGHGCCPPEYGGLKFSTGPDQDLEVIPWAWDPSIPEISLEGFRKETFWKYCNELPRFLAITGLTFKPEKNKGTSSMEKVMKTEQRTTARVLSGRDAEGKEVALPISYEVQYSAPGGIVNLDTNSNGECTITSLAEGSVDVTAVVTFANAQGPQRITDSFTIVVVGRTPPPPPEPVMIGLNFQIDEPVDVTPTPTDIIIRTKSVRVNNRK